MRQLSGRSISAFYDGCSHNGVIIGFGPRSLYKEREWIVHFEDRRKESKCSALDITRWLIPPSGTNLPRGMCQFIGRRVELIRNEKILGGRVDRVLPPCKWMIQFENGTQTSCCAQELLLWMRPRQDDTHITSSRTSSHQHIGDANASDTEEEDSLRKQLKDINSNNVSGDLDCCEVRKSSIPGAGLGLFAIKVINPGQRITKYSGRPISHAEAEASNSSYILHVNSKMCLDATGSGHMVGRFTNEGAISGRVNNARFGAQQVCYTCKRTGRQWSPIIATRKILPDEEIFAPYGEGACGMEEPAEWRRR